MDCQLSAEELARDLGEDAGPVTRSIMGAGTTVIQAFQAIDAQSHHPV
jgi:hypothetical protein